MFGSERITGKCFLVELRTDNLPHYSLSCSNTFVQAVSSLMMNGRLTISTESVNHSLHQVVDHLAVVPSCLDNVDKAGQ